MKIKQHVICQDDTMYQAWPDVELLANGHLLCVFAECCHHLDRSETQIVLKESKDRGSTWYNKRYLTVNTKDKDYYYNCPRIKRLSDGRLCVIVDRIYGQNENTDESRIVLFFSADNGKSWAKPQVTPILGIVPDKICELSSGRFLLAAHCFDQASERLVQRMWASNDKGASWEGPVIIGKDPDLNLCEASLFEYGGKVIALMRENSNSGHDAVAAISGDGGKSWGKLFKVPLPGCHRPVGALMNNDKLLVLYRFFQGGKNWGRFCNFFGAVCAPDELLTEERNEIGFRIFPIDYDTSADCDTGYSGWVQLSGQQIYAVNYIVNENSKACIVGYSFYVSDFVKNKKPC